jgi:hypothetical protein
MAQAVAAFVFPRGERETVLIRDSNSGTEVNFYSTTGYPSILTRETGYLRPAGENPFYDIYVFLRNGRWMIRANYYHSGEMVTVDGIEAPPYRAVELFPGISCLTVGRFRARFVVDLAAAPVPYAASDFATLSDVVSSEKRLEDIVQSARRRSLECYSDLDPSASGSCVVCGAVVEYTFTEPPQIRGGVTSAKWFNSKVAARRAFLDGRSAEEWVVLVPEDPRLKKLFTENKYEGFQGLSEWRVWDEARRAYARIQQRISGALAERRDQKRERKERAKCELRDEEDDAKRRASTVDARDRDATPLVLQLVVPFGGMGCLAAISLASRQSLTLVAVETLERERRVPYGDLRMGHESSYQKTLFAATDPPDLWREARDAAAAASLAKDVSTFGAAFADEFGSQVQLGWTRHTERKYAAHARVVANPPPPRTPLWQRVLVGPSALDHGESWQKRLYASSYPRLALATPVGDWWTRARVDALATALHGKTTSLTALVDSFVEAQFADAPSKCTGKEKAADAAAVAAAKRAARRDAKWAAHALVSWRSRAALGGEDWRVPHYVVNDGCRVAVAPGRRDLTVEGRVDAPPRHPSELVPSGQTLLTSFFAKPRG